MPTLLACAPARTPPPPAEGAARQADVPDEALADFERRYMSCTAEGLADFIGKPPSERNLEALRAASGAQAVQVVGTGEMSMEGSTGRLNVELDEEGRMRRFSCG